jgi:hypothetical protein
MRQAFNLSYTNADTLYQAWASDKDMSKDDIKKLIESFDKKPPSANNPELAAAKIIAGITNIYTQSGMDKWKETVEKLEEELVNAIQEHNKNTGGPAPSSSKPVDFEGTRQAFKAMNIAEKQSGKMFERFGSSEDKKGYKNFNSILSGAFSSGNESQASSANEIVSLLNILPDDVLKSWNTSNKANVFANSDGIEGLHKDLQDLINATKNNGRANVIIE